MSKKILLATRPLVPPWDEASKNFAYFLGREVQHHSLTLLTTNQLLDGVSLNVLQEPIFLSNRFDIFAKMNLFRYLRKVRGSFDVTHYLFTPTKQNTSIIKWFARPTKGKTIQTIATLREDLYSTDDLRSMLFADMLITYTNQTREKLKALGFENVDCIYPGIDLHRYHPQPKERDILNQLGYNESHFIVIYPGEYARLGATDMLTDSFIDFFTKNPATSIRFVFACRVKNNEDAKKKEEVKKRFLVAGLVGYVSFSDTISDMPALYNTSDIVIFPVSNLNGKFDVPLVIIEAYACGKPVILTDLPQFREFANEQICVTIPKDSGTKLIESVAYLKENIALRENIGHQARLFVEQHFDLRNTTKAYEAIYESL